MKVIIVGYGKMGRMIEILLPKNNHEIVGIISSETLEEDKLEMIGKADVAIEFSHPEAAFTNIQFLLEHDLPVVSGTTGWLDRFQEISDTVDARKGAFFYASNFSIGVNIFFAINEKLARLMNPYDEYEISIDETHHIHKKDAPSGTAISLAEGILNHVERKDNWSMEEGRDAIYINADRKGDVFGIHQIDYRSGTDLIQIRHEALSREGFAMGAIQAAQWLIGRVGVYSMKDLLEL